MSSTILEFPKSAIVRDLPSHKNEQLEALKTKSIINYAEAMSFEMREELLMTLDSCGIDTDTPEFAKDFSLASAILTACIFRSLGLKHDLHSFIDNSVDVKEAKPSETTS